MLPRWIFYHIEIKIKNGSWSFRHWWLIIQMVLNLWGCPWQSGHFPSVNSEKQSDNDGIRWTWAGRVERSFWWVWQGDPLEIPQTCWIADWHFPQDGSGTISTVELLHVLRAMGQNPSEDELNTIIMEIDIDGSGTIDFMEFVNLMREKITEVDIENDIREIIFLKHYYIYKGRRPNKKTSYSVTLSLLPLTPSLPRPKVTNLISDKVVFWKPPPS